MRSVARVKKAAAATEGAESGSVERVIGEGDWVAVLWRMEGKHEGPLGGLEATNREVQVQGTTWLCFKEGRIVEGCDTWNLGALLASLSP